MSLVTMYYLSQWDRSKVDSDIGKGVPRKFELIAEYLGYDHLHNSLSLTGKKKDHLFPDWPNKLVNMFINDVHKFLSYSINYP